MAAGKGREEEVGTPPGRGARLPAKAKIEGFISDEGPADDEDGVGRGGVESVAGGGRSWLGAKCALLCWC